MKSTRKASKPQKKLSPLTGSRDMNHKMTKIMPAANLTKKPISDRQPLSACGQLRCPRFMEIPVTKKTSKSQCTPVTITEIESIPNRYSASTAAASFDKSDPNNNVIVKRKTSQFLVQPGGGQQSLDLYTDTESIFSNSTNDNASDEVTMIVPQNVTSYQVMSTDKNTNYHLSQRTSRNDNDNNNNDSVQTTFGVNNNVMNQTMFNACMQFGLNQFSLKRLPYIVFGLVIFFFFFPFASVIIYSILGYIAYHFLSGGSISGSGTSGKSKSRRTVTWTIQDFSDEIRNGFLTCPPFSDKSGTWRLVVTQKVVLEGLQTQMGLLATDIPPNLAYVLTNIKFSCTNAYGAQLAPGLTRLKLQHRFERSGDFVCTQPLIFSQRLLGTDDVVNVVCRIDFQSVSIGYAKMAMDYIGLGPPPQKSNHVDREIGSIQQETLIYQNTPSSMIHSITRFVQHPDTKTFAWEIPNFSLHLKSKDVWGVISPQFFCNTDDFCSVWRMKLIEVSGVFRIHIQLRGLPKNIQQIKIWYLLQLVDNFQDSVVPENSVSRVKYPDHLNLWETSRHVLYRRETLLSRFIGLDGSFRIRLSIQVLPNEIPLLEEESDHWIQ